MTGDAGEVPREKGCKGQGQEDIDHDVDGTMEQEEEEFQRFAEEAEGNVLEDAPEHGAKSRRRGGLVERSEASRRRAPGPSRKRQEHLDAIIAFAGAGQRGRLFRILDILTV